MQALTTIPQYDPALKDRDGLTAKQRALLDLVTDKPLPESISRIIDQLPAWRRDPCLGGPKVYLLWAEGTNRFKIGFTAHSVLGRWRSIRNHCPLSVYVLGTKVGTVEDESNLHKLLHLHRTHAEWFELPDSIAWYLMGYFGGTPKWFADLNIKQKSNFAAVNNLILNGLPAQQVLEYVNAA